VGQLIAISLFLCATALKLCLFLPTSLWWASVAVVVLYGLFRTVARGITMPPTLWVAWGGAFLLFKCASFGWTIDTGATTKDVLHFMGILVFIFAALQLFGTDRARKLLGIASLWAGSFLILFLLVLLFQYAMKYGYVSGKHFKYVMAMRRGFNIHAMVFTYSVLTALTFLYIIRASGLKKWILSSIFVVIPVVTAYLTSTRSVVLFLATFYALLVVFHFFKNIRWVINVAMVAVTIIFLLYVGFGEGLLSKEITKSSTYRNLIWSRALHVAMDAPLNGYGYGSAGKVLGQMTRTETIGVSEDFGGGAHNLFLNALLSGGIIGLVLVMAFFSTIIASGQRWRGYDGRAILLALVVALWARGFVELGGLFGTGDGVADYVSWLVIAVYCGNISEEKRSKGDERNLPKEIFSPKHGFVEGH
jgi:O-antigen ligase